MKRWGEGSHLERGFRRKTLLFREGVTVRTSNPGIWLRAVRGRQVFLDVSIVTLEATPTRERRGVSKKASDGLTPGVWLGRGPGQRAARGVLIHSIMFTSLILRARTCGIRDNPCVPSAAVWSGWW